MNMLQHINTITSSRLLYSILPPSVAHELRHQRPVPAQRYESVTLLFAGISGFTQFCAQNSNNPLRIVDLLNSYYKEFDGIIDMPKYSDVYKVPTRNMLIYLLFRLDL